MSDPDGLAKLLRMLVDEGVELIVVGMMSGVLQGAEVTTGDLDVVPRRAAENLDRLHALLSSIHAVHLDFANRRIPVSRSALAGSGHVLLQTDLGRIDVLCEVAEGESYEALLPSSEVLTDGARALRVLSLPALIQMKRRAGRPKDRLAIPVLIATLEERQRREGKAD